MKRNTRIVRPLVYFALFSLFVISILCTMPANADELYASIRGTVTDQSGALVPDARITVTNVATGLSKTVTSKDGEFAILQLPVGNYSVRIEKPGFRTYTASGVHLDVNQAYALNAKIELGAVSESVTVEANQVQVETSPQRGDVVDANQILNLPLIGRTWVNLQQLESGVVAASDARGECATNGSQTTQNSFLINGTDTNDLPLNTRTVVPSEDAIEEFRMVTNTINPEYGRNSGAIMNAIIKSGSNGFHGDVFEFYRDTFLNAKDWFTHSAAIFHQNTFGGTIGGPIWKNHSFFFFSYQGTRNREPQPQGANNSSPVYTAGQRNGAAGAFTGIGNNVSPFPLVGSNGTTYPAGTPYSTIFSNGSIPTADFNPIAAKLVSQYVPLPNAGDNVFTFTPVQVTTDDQYLFRIDQNIGKRDLLWGSWLQESLPFTGTIPFPGTGASLPGFGEVNQQHFKLLTLSWSHTLNDHMINELRGGYNRFNYAAVDPAQVTQPSSLGFNITPQDPAAAGLPAMFITGFFNLGFSQFGPQPRKDQTYEVVDNFSFTHGNHTLKAGWDMRRFQVDNPFFAQNSGQYLYNGGGTYSTGNPGADFLLGIPDLYSQQSGGNGIDRAQEYYSYFQDQWKVRPNFTLTYGLGWQIDTAMQDLAYGGHGMAAFYPGQQSTVFPNAPLGVVYSGDRGVHPTGTNHPFRNFGPRVGFAYSPDWGKLTGGPGKTSIRGGFGMYYNRTEEELNLQFQGVPPNSIASNGVVADECTAPAPNCPVTITGSSPSFANPFADITGNTTLHPSVANPFPFTGAPSNVQFTSTNGNLPIWSVCCSTIDPKNVDPTSYNYNLTIERQISASMIASVGYVGAFARHLEIGHPLNLVNPAACLAAGPNVCTPGNQLTTFPQDYLYPGNIYGTIDQISTFGNSHYNSLQAGLKKKLSRGLQFTANYTWSHSFDNGSGFENTSFGGGGFGGLSATRAYNPYLPASNFGSSIFDARNRLVIGYVYELPHPRTGNGLLNRATKGWTISGITTFQSGFPMDVIDSSAWSLRDYPGNSDFATLDVPNLVAPVQYLNPRKTNASNGVAQWFSATPFVSYCPTNGNASGCVPAGGFGNTPRNVLHGPGINNWDFQLFKDTNITETTRLELRIEFYNVFNHENFWAGGIVNNIQAPNFGQVTGDNPSTGQGPRLIQLAAKFYF